jgi:hypothetical protein
MVPLTIAMPMFIKLLRERSVRGALIAVWLLLLLCGVALTFWYQQLRYERPTPVPPHYRSVSGGAEVPLRKYLGSDQRKPVLLHFFNPDCPCSRFNMCHVKELIADYGRQVDFVVVLMNERYATAGQVAEKFDLQVPVIVSPELASACGVYSTPQAALLTSAYRLYYRGNYNTNRYCTDPKTEFARHAILDLLKHQPIVTADARATTAYGCSLPLH